MPCSSKPAPAEVRKEQNTTFYKQKLQLHVHNAPCLNKKTIVTASGTLPSSKHHLKTVNTLDFHEEFHKDFLPK